MKHLILCREYPPAPGGGIGTYVFILSRLLAGRGETVHVISQAWEGAPGTVQEECNGRLLIHRLPFEDWTALRRPKLHPALQSPLDRSFFKTGFYPQGFSWHAGLLAERLVVEEGIDIIEAQEYEAPLYYFLLRRALGLGPSRCPPCIVHLHSPTELIAGNNDWDLSAPSILTAKRLEDYCISAADALLCPSAYLARQAEQHYVIEPETIQIIPLPRDADADWRIERSPGTWEKGTICYIGRLERRKGIMEWIGAAVEISRENPQAVFEFVGPNILGRNPIESALLLRNLIPEDLRSRFVFHGEQPRRRISEFLARARMAVVPSRWENFPYTCIEAMSSGLPVLATRQGGMAEMIRDGVTGWLVDQPGGDGLAQTLRRALQCPPAALAEMGHQASVEIERICNSQSVTEQQLEFRRRVARQPAERSHSLPAWPLTSGRRPPASLSEKPALEAEAAGIFLVLTVPSRDTRGFSRSLQSIARQVEKPVAAGLVTGPGQGSSSLRPRAMLRALLAVTGLPAERVKIFSSKQAAVQWAAGFNPSGFVFLQAGDRPRPEFIARCHQVLSRCATIGIVSFWAQGSQRGLPFSIRPCPALPYQILEDDVDPACAFRTEALQSVRDYRAKQAAGQDARQLSVAILNSGWAAVTVPEVLMERPARFSHPNYPAYPERPWALKLTDVVDLARRDPSFYLKLVAAAFIRLKKKSQGNAQ